MHESTAALFVLFIAASLEFMYPLEDAAAAFAHRVLDYICFARAGCLTY